MTGRVATANRLTDGAVVYLTAAGGWSRDLGDGLVAATDAEVVRIEDEAAGAEAACRVVGAYLIEVTVQDGAVRPVRLREAIRASGPTVSGAAGNHGNGSHVPVR